jgi:hypothetical protein
MRGDSIYKGADVDATVGVAVLAIGRAFARRPGRRSAAVGAEAGPNRATGTIRARMAAIVAILGGVP